MDTIFMSPRIEFPPFTERVPEDQRGGQFLSTLGKALWSGWLFMLDA
jgi:hypothetical protein